MDNELGSTAKPTLARPRPVVAIPESVLNGTMTPAQAARAELERQRNNPSAEPIISLEVQDEEHVTAWVVAAPIEIARLRARAEAEAAMRDGTYHEKLAASRAAQAARTAASTVPPLPAQSASWGVRNALAAVGLVSPAPSVPTDNPNNTTVSAPPIVLDIQDNDGASSSTQPQQPNDNALDAPANNEHPASMLGSMIDLGLEVPAEQADGLAASVLPDTLRDLEIPEAIDIPVNNTPAINVQDIEAVVVSPPLPPEAAPVDVPEEEITLAEAEHNDEPLLEEGEVEAQIATERARQALLLQQAEEIQRQLDETTRIERARADALVAQQQALLFQKEQEEAKIREEAARKVQAELAAAVAFQERQAATLRDGRAGGFI